MEHLRNAIRPVGISLGWSCSSASKGVELGIRSTKANGYKTCPFDAMNTNHIGLLACLKEDFRYFCDPAYLKLYTFSDSDKYYPGETLIVNTRYGFIFNHESPGHASLYKTQAWPGGINHFVDNNFEEFIKRYQRRIQNFRAYVRSSRCITFLITCPESQTADLRHVLNSMCAHTFVRFDVKEEETYNDHLEIMRKVSLP
jgi:hypothetical protein